MRVGVWECTVNKQSTSWHRTLFKSSFLCLTVKNWHSAATWATAVRSDTQTLIQNPAWRIWSSVFWLREAFVGFDFGLFRSFAFVFPFQIFSLGHCQIQETDNENIFTWSFLLRNGLPLCSLLPLLGVHSRAVCWASLPTLRRSVPLFSLNRAARTNWSGLKKMLSCISYQLWGDYLVTAWCLLAEGSLIR